MTAPITTEEMLETMNLLVAESNDCNVVAGSEAEKTIHILAAIRSFIHSHSTTPATTQHAAEDLLSNLAYSQAYNEGESGAIKLIASALLAAERRGKCHS